MSNRLQGKVAVVTGAGRGIGRGVALLLAEEGAKVVVNDLGGELDGTGASTSPAAEVVAEIKKKGGEAVANGDSVASMEGGERIIQTAVDNFGKIDILVTVAGILRDRMVFNMTEEEWDDVIAVHLKGTFTCIKYASILMRQQRSGRIVVFSSTSGLYGASGQANYGAAKDGIAGIVRCVSQDLGKYGITCNGISPAAATRMTLTDEVRKAREIRAAAGQASNEDERLDQPEDVAPAVVFLATDEAQNFNGEILHVSGGFIGRMSHPDEVKTMWKKDGRWTYEEIAREFPIIIGLDLVNPAPPQVPRS
ncbi:MAG: SDR family oxidoreductase [Chloroflexi bacterium]|nr:SDR family oxidoreductase [Chloroflexota bacterium]